MILGEYPFLGDTLQDTYDKVRNKYKRVFGLFAMIFDDIYLTFMLLVFIHYYKSWHTVFFLIQIVNNPLVLPKDMNPQLRHLIEGLLFKGTWHSTIPHITWLLCIFLLIPNCDLKYADPRLRMTLGDVAEDSWVIGDDGPIPEYLCWCKRKIFEREDNDESNMLPWSIIPAKFIFRLHLFYVQWKIPDIIFPRLTIRLDRMIIEVGLKENVAHAGIISSKGLCILVWNHLFDLMSWNLGVLYSALYTHRMMSFELLLLGIDAEFKLQCMYYPAGCYVLLLLYTLKDYQHLLTIYPKVFSYHVINSDMRVPFHCYEIP